MSQTDANPVEEEIFVARLSPHRSLPRENLRILLWFFAAASVVTTLPFLLMGFWPILMYTAIDVALLYVAFRANYRAALAYELVRLTPLELQLARVSVRGARTEWRFNPAWVRLEREEDEEFGTSHLALVSRDKRVEIARFLGPNQKAQFADALARALSVARRGPRFS